MIYSRADLDDPARRERVPRNVQEVLSDAHQEVWVPDQIGDATPHRFDFCFACELHVCGGFRPNLKPPRD
jgi:hypothetical protein